MKKVARNSSGKIGRPLSFDRDAALQQALLLFWRYGYEGTSLQNLTTAIGVTPPSIYTAFGDKKRLFLEAVDRYLSGPVNPFSIIRSSPGAREAAVSLLQSAAIGYTGESTPAGCLLATAAISCSATAADIQDKLAGIRRKIEATLRDKIREDIEAGRMAGVTDPEVLAGYIMAVLQGMSTLARDGAGREKLMRVAATAMLAWPCNASGTHSELPKALY